MRLVWAGISLILLAGCSLKAEFSMMKQWDRPAEKITIEDTSHNVKQPPRTVVETQDPVVVAPPSSGAGTTIIVPQTPAKQMNFEAPEMIVPKASPIQYMYLHQHGDEKHTCYVRKTVGIYATNIGH